MLHIACLIRLSCLFRVNFWGYSTIGFFSPMIRYSSTRSHKFAGRAINEFKILVKEAHKRGIEVTTGFQVAIYSLLGLRMQFLIDFKQVIMDVVLNHTAEGNEKGPIFSFRGVDNSVYYMLAPKVMVIKQSCVFSVSLLREQETIKRSVGSESEI